MTSKKAFKKKNNYRNSEDEIRIKERRKQKNKKFRKQDIYAMREEEEDLNYNPYDYLNE